VFAQIAAGFVQQVGILGKAFHENIFGAIQHRLDIGKAQFDVEVFLRFLFRSKCRIGKQGVGERLQPCLNGDLALGAALGFIGQIEVFKAGLGVGVENILLQLRAELALFVDTQDPAGRAAVRAGRATGYRRGSR